VSEEYVRFLCSGRDMSVLMCRGVVMVSGAVCCCGGRAPMATARPRLQLPPHLSRATRRRHRPFSRDILSCAPVLLTIFTPHLTHLTMSPSLPCELRPRWHCPQQSANTRQTPPTSSRPSSPTSSKSCAHSTRKKANTSVCRQSSTMPGYIHHPRTHRILANMRRA
jgi:hypothetical protein